MELFISDKNRSIPSCTDIGSTPYYFIGSQSLLTCSPIAVYCSREIPLSIYHTVNETFTELLRLPIVVGGGWQSTMEKRALKNFSKESRAKIIYFLAKGIENFKIPLYLSSIMASGRLLIVSPFLNKLRIEKKHVAARDDLIFSLVDRFLFLYIKPDGHLEGLFTRCFDNDKEVYLLEHQANNRYVIDQVKTLSLKNLRELSI